MLPHDELYHYGVLGMKWGIRKDPERAAFREAIRKSELDRKIKKHEDKLNKKADKKIKRALRKEDGPYIRKQKQKLRIELEEKYAKEFREIRKHINDITDIENEDVASQYYKKYPIKLEDAGEYNTAGRKKLELIDRKCAELTSKIREAYKDSHIKSPNGIYSLKIGAIQADVEDPGNWLEPNIIVYDEEKGRDTIFMSGFDDELDKDKYLEHYGVLGMKWGVRKDDRVATPRSQRTPSQDYLRTKKIRKKRIKEMSNEELRDVTQRLQLETQYKAMTSRRINLGKKYAASMMGQTEAEVRRQVSKKVATEIVKAAIMV